MIMTQEKLCEVTLLLTYQNLDNNIFCNFVDIKARKIDFMK